MDIKIKGITPELMRQALEQAKVGRLHILGKMAELGLATSRPALSEKAPVMMKMHIPTNKIRDVIVWSMLTKSRRFSGLLLPIL